MDTHDELTTDPYAHEREVNFYRIQLAYHLGKLKQSHEDLGPALTFHQAEVRTCADTLETFDYRFPEDIRAAITAASGYAFRLPAKGREG